MQWNHRNTLCLFFTFITCLCCVAFPVCAAEIYKWTDAQGRVHYGDKPVDGNSTETIPVKPGVNDSTEQATERLERQQRVLDAMESRRNERREELDKKQAKLTAEKQHKQECARLRNDLVDYERGGVIWYDLDDNGERQFLDHNDIEKRKRDLRAEIGRYCSNGY